MLTCDPHPALDAVALITTWPEPLGDAPEALRALAPPPLPTRADAVGLVRDLLRVGGFKPAGRNKPCNEYIAKAAADDAFPWINIAVDLTNLAVLHGGLPISTVDLDRIRAPLRLGLAPPGARYVFNRSGQAIDIGGLITLFDADGPCANPVKDSQRAKTDGATRHTLTVVWGTSAWPGRAEQVAAWFADQAAALGATVAREPLRAS